MANHSSATERKESPHLIQSTNRTISLDLKRRAQSIINNKSIDAGTRAVIRYGLEINDPLLPQLVRRTEAGEIIIDNLNPPTPKSSQNYSDANNSVKDHSVEYDSVEDHSGEDDSAEYHLDRNSSGKNHADENDSIEDHSVEDELVEAKIETLTFLICRAGDEPETKSAALLVLMATLENTRHPKSLTNIAKHLAFTRCCELNFHGMLDTQIAIVERELLANHTLMR